MPPDFYALPELIIIFSQLIPPQTPLAGSDKRMLMESITVATKQNVLLEHCVLIMQRELHTGACSRLTSVGSGCEVR